MVKIEYITLNGIRYKAEPLSGETSTNEGDAESAITTDCISRADTLKVLCAECDINSHCYYPDKEAYCTQYAVVKGMPPINQKQITGKLKNSENATSEGEESTTGQPKNKLDCISRQDAIGAWDKLSKRGRTEFDQVLMTLPSATPTISEDCISRKQAIEAVEEQCFGGTIIDINPSWRILHNILESIPPVTPTERTGEWIGSGDGYDYNGELVYDIWECSECGYTIDEDDTDLLPKYCQECGAKMGGDSE